jgi:hypothetical protein
MAEGSGGRKEEKEEEEWLLMMRSGDSGLEMNACELRPGEGDGGAVEIGKNAVANVICFGSIEAVLDGRGEDENESRKERGGVESEKRHRQGEKGKDLRSERSLGKGCYANGVNGTGDGRMEEVVSRRRRERRERRKEATGSVEGMATMDAVSLDVCAGGIDRSSSLGDGRAVNVERGACEGPLDVEEGSLNSDSVQEGNGSPGGEVHCKVVDNGRAEAGSVEVGPVGSGVADVDCGQSGSSAEDESRNAVSQMPSIPRPLPPVLSSVEERSMRLAWVGCAMAVSYELDYACNEVLVPSKKGLNSSSLGGDLKWTSVSCGEGLSYKVCNFGYSLILIKVYPMSDVLELLSMFRPGTYLLYPLLRL